MVRDGIVVMVFMFLAASCFSQSSSDIFSKNTFSVDLPIIYHPYNFQSNFIDEGLPIHTDRNTSIGVEFTKVNPNKDQGYSTRARYMRRNFYFSESPLVLLNEHLGILEYTFRKFKSTTTPKYLDITKPFFGAGLSLSYSFSSMLEARALQSTFSQDDLINKIRVEGLISAGILEDVFNIGQNTSNSKFEALLRFPILSLSQSLTNNFKNLPPELEFLQKTKSSKLSIEVRYSHLIDSKRNIYNNFIVALEDDWKEVQDPLKRFVPPVFNVTYPKNSIYGNFVASIELYNLTDTLVTPSNNELVLKRSLFKQFEIGYSLHFLSNYHKHSSAGGYRDLITLNDKGWRRDLFVSASYGNRLDDHVENGTSSSTLQSYINFSGGGQLRNVNRNLIFALGASYYYDLFTENFGTDVIDSDRIFQNSSFFIAFGKFNTYLKLQSRVENFVPENLKDLIDNLSISLSFGI